MDYRSTRMLIAVLVSSVKQHFLHISSYFILRSRTSFDKRLSNGNLQNFIGLSVVDYSQ